MSESSLYERVKGGRLTFKGGALATRSKGVDKKKKKNKHNNKDTLEEQKNNAEEEPTTITGGGSGTEGGEVIYTIDAAKKMKYEDLFPVEAKKFGYDPKSTSKSVENALDERVKKKADRYCK